MMAYCTERVRDRLDSASVPVEMSSTVMASNTIIAGPVAWSR